MDLVTEKFTLTELSKYSYSFSGDASLESLESMLLNSISQDNKRQLMVHSKQLFSCTNRAFNFSTKEERAIVSKLFHHCCMCDSIECATALLNGELGGGLVPLVNDMSAETGGGMSPLHAAAEAHAKRCAELLLKKHARTDLKSRDGRGLLALELALCSDRMDVIWNSDKHSVEDLIVCLGEKDLTVVKLLSDKTKEFDDVAYAMAIKGRVVSLAALLVVGAAKVIESMVVLHDDSGYKEKTTIYECVIREALALRRTTTHTSDNKSDTAERRKLLLCEIELLQLFGAAQRRCTDKKVTSPLILACKEGDETVIELLLKTNIDVNDADAGGNSALHWSLKASKRSFEQQMRLVCLLLKHGAEVSQKNMMGSSAVHMAAANGNLHVLQVLLLEDPDCIYSKTATHETPLFFAVKNDHLDCAELLLQWGADSEVYSLRKKRPIDLAKSQDMRFMLNPVNITLMSRAGPSQHKYNSALGGDEDILETCKALLNMTQEGSTTERICSITKTEVCKYFDSQRGCARGTTCFYAHDEEELQQMKQETGLNNSPAAKMAKMLTRKVFVGGLPPSVDSDSLSKFFEKEFGLVEDAVVVGHETETEVKSRGFGFVTFKHKESVSAAVQAHYTTIMGKQVEIKGAVPKSLLEFQKTSPRQLEQKQEGQYQPLSQMSGEKTTVETPSLKTKDHMSCLKSSNEKTTEDTSSSKTVEKFKFELKSWVDMLLRGQRKTCSTATKAHASTSHEEQNLPEWLKNFKKWLPNFLKDVSKNSREGHYALSSLKADFKAACGLELDHASLGYSKLSDFVKSCPEVCQIKFVPVGKYGYANHLVLFPCPPHPHKQLLQPTSTYCIPSCATPNHDSGNGNSNGSEGSEDHLSMSTENFSFISSSSEEGKLSSVFPEENLAKGASPNVYSRFLKFLEPDAHFCSHPWLYKGRDGGQRDTVDEAGALVGGFSGVTLSNQRRHLVLEALARKRNNSSVFFLREFDFYDNYQASITQGKCFGCNQHRLLWANFPCRHLLWCSDCKIQFSLAAGSFEHDCVVCDAKVQKIDLLPSIANNRPLFADLCNDAEFPPLIAHM